MNLSEVTTLILAGGFGTRLREAVPDTPKPLAPVAGVPFIVYLLKYLSRYGIEDVVICNGYKGEMLKDTLGSGYEWGVKLRYSTEEKPLGTAGALKNAESMITSDPFLVLNGDSLIEVDLKRFFAFHSQREAVLSLVLSQSKGEDRFGSVSLGHRGVIRQFQEKVQTQGWINGGVYLINRSVLDSIKKDEKASLEYDVFPQYLQGGLYGIKCTSSLIDIGTPESYNCAQTKMKDYLEDEYELLER